MLNTTHAPSVIRKGPRTDGPPSLTPVDRAELLLEARSTAKELLRTLMLREHDVIAHAANSGEQILWRQERDGLIAVGSFAHIQGTEMSFVQWENSRGETSCEVEDPRLREYLLKHPNTGLLTASDFYQSPVFVEPSHAEILHFIQNCQAAQSQECGVSLQAKNTYSLENISLENGRLELSARKISDQQNSFDPDPIESTYRNARKLAEELSLYGITPRLELPEYAAEALEMARMHALAGWKISFPPGLGPKARSHRFLRFGEVGGPPLSIVNVGSGEPDNKGVSEPPPSLKSKKTALEIKSVAGRSPNWKDFIDLSELAESLRRSPDDPGIFFHGFTTGHLKPKDFQDLSRAGTRFYLLREEGNLVAAAVVDPPDLAHTCRPIERLGPGKAGETSFIRWILIRPTSGLTGNRYQMLIEQVAKSEAGLGANTLSGLTHPLNKRGVKVHQALGKFTIWPQSVSLDGKTYGVMSRRLSDTSPQLASTTTEDRVLTTEQKDTLIRYCQERLSLYELARNLVHTCQRSLCLGERRNAAHAFLGQAVEILDRKHLSSLQASIWDLVYNQKDHQGMTNFRHSFTQAIQEPEAQLEKTLRSQGASWSRKDNTQKESLISDQKRIQEELELQLALDESSALKPVSIQAALRADYDLDLLPLLLISGTPQQREFGYSTLSQGLERKGRRLFDFQSFLRPGCKADASAQMRRIQYLADNIFRVVQADLLTPELAGRSVRLLQRLLHSFEA
jgi:hypothetical protein